MTLKKPKKLSFYIILTPSCCSNILSMICHHSEWTYDNVSNKTSIKMMVIARREKGLTLGTQSICAVLCGLAVSFTRSALVSGGWGAAPPNSLPLTLAAAHGPLTPLIPASINCSMRINTTLSGTGWCSH